MGLEYFYSTFAAEVAAVVDVVTSPEEEVRRLNAQVRVKFYYDDYKDLLNRLISEVFRETEVVNRLRPFVQLVGGTSFLKRISDELARPLYARAPMRRVFMPGELEAAANLEDYDDPQDAPLPEITNEQDAWNHLVEEMRLNEKADQISRLLVPCNKMFARPRFLQSKGEMGLDVMTPDMVSVVPDPSNPTDALAIAYIVGRDSRGNATRWAVWDDVKRFYIDSMGHVAGEPVKHGHGLLSIVEFTRRGKPGCYWDRTTGEDLVSTTKFGMLMDLIMVRKLKSQSHIQLVYNGPDASGFIKDQVTDEESIIMALGGGALTPINLESDPTAILAAKAAMETSVAANHGINRERLNQDSSVGGKEDAGFKERVSEHAQIVYRGEAKLFAACAAVSKEHPKYQIPREAKQMLDLGYVTNRMDRKTQIEIRRMEAQDGYRSELDNVLEDKPQFGGDRRLAAAFLKEKSRERTMAIALKRWNMKDEGNSAEEPGLSPSENGKLGPLKRDGKITGDEAAEMSKGKKPSKDLKAMARRVLDA